MSPEEIAQAARAAFHEAQKEEDDRKAAIAEQERLVQERIDNAVKEANRSMAKEYAKSRRLPTGDAGQPGGAPPAMPYVTAYADTRKFDSLDVRDLSFLCTVLDAAKREHRSQSGMSESAAKALALRICEDKSPLGDEARRDLKAAGIDPAEVTNAMKANELDYSTSAGFGDEWVGVEYSRRLWPAIRQGSPIAAMIPTVEVPQGAESLVVPLESTDPTWYKVAQTTANNSTTLRPNGTIVSSRAGTAQKVLTPGKMGARVSYSAELEEDSFVTWAPQLRAQMETSGSESLEHLVIDGDVEAGATANINTIGGTPGGTELYLLFDGFRKSPLVTTTANSRSASGSLVDTDFIETIKLMGPAGANAIDKTKVGFILDLNVGWKVLSLVSVKTHDVFTNATLENGILTSIWGYPVFTSAFMHWLSSTNPRKANTAGKVDLTTQGNNTTGSILAVRWDQWLLGYKRRVRIKIEEFPGADSTDIIAIARVGMVQRDEAAAISYNCGV